MYSVNRSFSEIQFAQIHYLITQNIFPIRKFLSTYVCSFPFPFANFTLEILVHIGFWLDIPLLRRWYCGWLPSIFERFFETIKQFLRVSSSMLLSCFPFPIANFTFEMLVLKGFWLDTLLLRWYCGWLRSIFERFFKSSKQFLEWAVPVVL